MKAVISTTYDDTYFFFLPIVVWSWKKLGIDTICFISQLDGMQLVQDENFSGIWLDIDKAPEKLLLALKQNTPCKLIPFTAPLHKEATYAQCSRLYAAALSDLPDDEILITGDVDMAVFNKEYFAQANNECINVFGIDLVPENQYPICYISMPVKTWRDVMSIAARDTLQKHLDQLLGHLECDHFKGNYWAKDQETIYNQILQSDKRIVGRYRAKYPHQFATHRADRDGWPDTAPPGIIDAHLPRPGYTEENFAKILKLFQEVYPDEDFGWMTDYRNEYIKLL